MMENIFLYSLTRNDFFICDELTPQLIKKYYLTLIDTEGALYADRTVEGSETQQKIGEHCRRVIAGEVEGSGEYPSELVLETLYLKITYDKHFKGFLFSSYPFKVSLWQKFDEFFKRQNLSLPSMLLLAPFNDLRKLVQQVKKLEQENIINYDVQKSTLIHNYYDYIAYLIDYFESQDRFQIINSSNKSNEEIFNEICQVIGSARQL